MGTLSPEPPGFRFTHKSGTTWSFIPVSWHPWAFHPTGDEIQSADIWQLAVCDYIHHCILSFFFLGLYSEFLIRPGSRLAPLNSRVLAVTGA